MAIEAAKKIMEQVKETLFDRVPPLNMRQVMAEAPPEMDWVVRHWIPGGTVGTMAAAGGVGKTNLMLLIGVQVAIASPVHFDPFKIEEPGSVLYINVEDPKDEITRRLHAIGKAYRLGTTDIELLEQNFTILPALGVLGPLMEIGDGGNPKTTEYYQLIKEQILKGGYRLVILDTKSRLFGLNENATNDNTEWVRQLEIICHETQTAFVVSHHQNKQGRQDGGTNAVRGAGAYTDNCRFVWGLQPITENLAEIFGVDPSKFVMMTLDKSNYSPGVKPLIFERVDGGVLMFRDLEKEQMAEEYGAFYRMFKDMVVGVDEVDCPSLNHILVAQRPTDKDDRLKKFQSEIKEFYEETTFTETSKKRIKRFVSRAIFMGDIEEVICGTTRKKTALCIPARRLEYI